MNDRFKYRFWDKLENKMVHSPIECAKILIERVGLLEMMKTTECDLCSDAYQKAGLMPIQCTGLKDKNGVLIYEGDVVKQNTYPFYGDEELKELNYLGVVFFWLEESCYYVNLHVVSDRVRGAACGRALFEYDCKNIEIIGNKFENPELLELTND